MSNARALVFAGFALLLGACSGWPRGAGFGLFGSTPAMPTTANIDLDSDPQGAEAKTSLGAGCQTPCALEVPTSGALSGTFTREGFAQCRDVVYELAGQIERARDVRVGIQPAVDMCVERQTGALMDIRPRLGIRNGLAHGAGR